MKRFLMILSLSLVASGLVLAMSGSPGDDIIIPPDNYVVEVTDIDGVVTVGSNVTFEKKTYVSAKRGSTSIFIPFDRIRMIEMLDSNEVITQELPEIDMRITLKDGSVYESTGGSSQEITGEAEFGSFRIRLDHIRKLSFSESADPSQMPE